MVNFKTSFVYILMIEIKKYFCGETPDYHDYTGGKNNFTYRMDIKDYEIKEIWFYFKIFIILVSLSLLILRMNFNNFTEFNLNALNKKGVINFINGTYSFTDFKGY